MKIRDGFVSNSSSSSFIVALNKIPKNKNDVKTIFYGGMDRSINYCTEKEINTDILSDVIWNDLKNQKPTKSIKKLEDTIGRGSVMDCLEPDSDDYIDRKSNIKSSPKGWDKYLTARNNYTELMAKMFLNANKKRFIYILEFSDNGGDIQEHLEHGDTFELVRHLTICCH